MQSYPSSNGLGEWEVNWNLEEEIGAKGRIEREKLYLNMFSNGASDKVIKTSRGGKQLDILRLFLNWGYKVDLCDRVLIDCWDKKIFYFRSAYVGALLLNST